MMGAAATGGATGGGGVTGAGGVSGEVGVGDTAAGGGVTACVLPAPLDAVLKDEQPETATVNATNANARID
jgi:hypothetical protein